MRSRVSRYRTVPPYGVDATPRTTPPAGHPQQAPGQAQAQQGQHERRRRQASYAASLDDQIDQQRRLQQMVSAGVPHDVAARQRVPGKMRRASQPPPPGESLPRLHADWEAGERDAAPVAPMPMPTMAAPGRDLLHRRVEELEQALHEERSARFQMEQQVKWLIGQHQKHSLAERMSAAERELGVQATINRERPQAATREELARLEKGVDVLGRQVAETRRSQTEVSGIVEGRVQRLEQSVQSMTSRLAEHADRHVDLAAMHAATERVDGLEAALSGVGKTINEVAARSERAETEARRIVDTVEDSMQRKLEQERAARKSNMDEFGRALQQRMAAAETQLTETYRQEVAALNERGAAMASSLWEQSLAEGIKSLHHTIEKLRDDTDSRLRDFVTVSQLDELGLGEAPAAPSVASTSEAPSTLGPAFHAQQQQAVAVAAVRETVASRIDAIQNWQMRAESRLDTLHSEVQRLDRAQGDAGETARELRARLTDAAEAEAALAEACGRLERGQASLDKSHAQTAERLEAAMLTLSVRVDCSAAQQQENLALVSGELRDLHEGTSGRLRETAERLETLGGALEEFEAGSGRGISAATETMQREVREAIDVMRAEGADNDMEERLHSTAEHLETKLNHNEAEVARVRRELQQEVSRVRREMQRDLDSLRREYHEEADNLRELATSPTRQAFESPARQHADDLRDAITEVSKAQADQTQRLQHMLQESVGELKTEFEQRLAAASPPPPLYPDKPQVADANDPLERALEEALGGFSAEVAAAGDAAAAATATAATGPEPVGPANDPDQAAYDRAAAELAAANQAAEAQPIVDPDLDQSYDQYEQPNGSQAAYDQAAYDQAAADQAAVDQAAVDQAAKEAYDQVAYNQAAADQAAYDQAAYDQAAADQAAAEQAAAEQAAADQALAPDPEPQQPDPAQAAAAFQAAAAAQQQAEAAATTPAPAE